MVSKTDSSMDDMGDYCQATYIRQNSENLQRLSSVTDSVCLTEEERRLMQQDSCHTCTCTRAEYCSTDCKNAKRQTQSVMAPAKSTTLTNLKPARPSMIRSLSQPCTSKLKSICQNFQNVEQKSVKFKDTILDVPEISSKDSIDSDKSSQCCRSVLKWACIIFWAVVLTTVVTILVWVFVLPHLNIGGQDARNDEVTGEARQTVTPYRPTGPDKLFDEIAESGPGVTYNSYTLDQTRFLDQKKFDKESSYLRWSPDEVSREFTLTEDDCLQVSQTAHYQIFSKVTFEFWPTTPTDTVYHNVQLVRDGNREILDKDLVTIPPTAMRTGRILKSSLVLVLQKFEAGDVICVMVQDTNLVYDSKLDNTLKIIRKL